MTFEEMNLDPRLKRALAAQDFVKPTPIQEQAIPIALEGRDLIGIAQTGTGKTLAYVLPVLSRLGAQKAEHNSVLVLTPTRELAQQVFNVAEEFGKALGMRSLAIYGGTPMRPQIEKLKRGAAVIIATPGRLLDHMSRGNMRFNNLQVLILDEADRMLDMGFLPDIRKIIRKLPDDRQTIMCSATWPDEIRKLADEMQHDPEQVTIGMISKPVEKVRQLLYPVFPEDKHKLMLDLLDKEHIYPAIVFCRTKERTERLYRILKRHGYKVAIIHGDRSQSQRQQALDGFRKGKFDLLVATDVAARGLDIEGISHVINYDIPQNADDYIHRIGRTARAEAEGDAFTFVSPQEHEHLATIERTLGRNLPRGEWERIAPVLSTYTPPGAKRRRRGAVRRADPGSMFRRR